ncbi:pyruvate dehydrogenase complex component Pdx1, putative [Talaromyces stipitatus ATCC 10500]|uniref:Pyruvate dehydrogenase complex component Pdx1, putative n=1 Tax=Talaromyces stipitatus (strain ATCC 10500 / CBS 375.48 / QM 6759 / NRRL 1006) TaxID=441959 RepID=B8MT96_TALSN|nr:pyruvate dehydrogenase complex component Pdx1, putative [Talaromyces stipitatus ATCC 10500]EED12279.1 pyruvate dehydrogenase complex component Pdx1, putative [Talaromyces stipitatus ATCC 10500]
MAASFTLKQVPLGLLRRQTPVNSITKRFASTLSQTPGGYPLYPSVSQLLLQKGIPESEVSKIPATGPKGRLLKGDVLAYLGEITAGYPAEQAARIEKMGHLDLSNIKIAPPPAPPAPAAAEEQVPELPSDISIAVSISLESVLSTQKRIKDAIGVTVPLSTFIARATEVANGELPRSAASKPSPSELFDELLGAAPIKYTRGNYVPEINTVPLEEFETIDEDVTSQQEEVDIIDILAGNVSPRRSSSSSSYAAATTPAPSALNVFSLTVPAGEEKRAKTFLDRLNTVLTVDPSRLVL